MKKNKIDTVGLEAVGIFVFIAVVIIVSAYIHRFI